ncbi:MAG: hypothetical protein IH851_05420 [Armatimonadetes bacterium]|nr:hypothetical protein [Armatimonadota bacterium]
MRYSSDIDPDAEYDVNKLDGQVTIAIRRTESAVRETPDDFGCHEALAELLCAFLTTHRAIRSLIKTIDTPDSQLGDALSLVREQIEKVFIVSLLLDDPEKWTRVYVRDGWQKGYKIFVLEREETKDLKRFQEWNTQSGPTLWEGFRRGIGITEVERDATEFIALNPRDTMPSDLQDHVIERFPSPSVRVAGRAREDIMKKVLKLWHAEYERYCDFSHILYGKLFLGRVAADARIDLSVRRKLLHDAADQGLTESYRTAGYVCAEICARKAKDLEALAAVDELWQVLRNASLFGKWLYEERVSGLLPLTPGAHGE